MTANISSVDNVQCYLTGCLQLKITLLTCNNCQVWEESTTASMWRISQANQQREHKLFGCNSKAVQRKLFSVVLQIKCFHSRVSTLNSLISLFSVSLSVGPWFSAWREANFQAFFFWCQHFVQPREILGRHHHPVSLNRIAFDLNLEMAPGFGAP